MLGDIGLYWFTDTAASSARIYWENTRAGMAACPADGIDLPMAPPSMPARDILPAKDLGGERCVPNLFYWNEVDEAGHFAAFEQPKLFTDELRKAFRYTQRG